MTMDHSGRMGMYLLYGAVIGDIAGSKYEFWDRKGKPMKSKEFDFFQKESRFTDDTVMTVAVANALLQAKESGESFLSCAERNMRDFGRRYERAGYGGRFLAWIHSDDPKPYNSWGNGSAMRDSAGWDAGIAGLVRKADALLPEEFSDIMRRFEMLCIDLYDS